MPLLIPLGLQPYARQRYFDPATGDPVELGSLAFFDVSTVNPQDVFADWQGATSLGTVVNLSASGYAPEIFIRPQGYRIRLFSGPDGTGDQLDQFDGISDPGTTFASTSGAIQGQGSKSVADTYVTLSSDGLVTVASTAAPFNITVGQTATARGLPLIILNAGDQVVSVNVLGGQTLNGQSGPLDIPASTGAPNYPGVILYPVAPSSWFAVSCPAFA